MRFRPRLATAALFGFVFAACSEPVTAPPEAIGFQPLHSVAAGGPLDAGPDDLIGEFEVDLLDRAINPADYVCTSTPLIDRINQQIIQLIVEEPEIIFPLANDLAGLAVPQDYAFLFETRDMPQFFGYTGEYTQLMQKTHRDASRFFDIDVERIHLVAMHGSTLRNRDAVIQTYLAYGIDLATAEVMADSVAVLLDASELLEDGNHPLFTFNAFAFRGGFGIPPKIVMGDGIMAAYEELGYGDVAPQGIYAHELAHHVQFQNGYFSDPLRLAMTTGAERTRYTELMADAYSAYFLTHSRGLALNKHRVAQFLQVFFNIGDCGFTSGGHHGTPLQRMRAAQLGFDIADQAQKQGHILSTEAFHDLFVEAWPDLIAPDV